MLIHTAFSVTLLLSILAGNAIVTELCQTNVCHLCIVRPAGFLEFDITEAMRNWQSGDPNYGVLLLATNENTLGRGIRFFSNAYGDSGKHALVNVLCDY